MNVNKAGFCKSNINTTFTNGADMIPGVRIAIFAEISNLSEELITFFFSIFGPENQKFVILTIRLEYKSLKVNFNSMRGD